MSDIKELQQLYELFINIDIDTIEIQSKKGSFSLSFLDQYQKRFTSADDIDTSPPTIVENESISRIIDVTSPAVGIFDRAHPKTQAYYIKLRDQVKKNQILGHIHVLGILHDITAPENGKIIDLLVEQDQPIEYGQPIIRLEVS